MILESIVTPACPYFMIATIVKISVEKIKSSYKLE